MAGPKANRKAVQPGAFPPAIQIQHFDDEQWEKFIESACSQMEDGHVKQYAQVKRMGGAGDGGRDIEARLVAGSALVAEKWDLFQAKHYAGPLQASEVFPEIAKFFLNLHGKTYPTPRRYFLCSPKNAGPDLQNLLAKPSEFKKEFLEAWRTGSRGMKSLKAHLSSDVEALVDAFDFSRFDEYLSRDLIQEHAKDEASHCKLFHIQMERGDDPAMPALPDTVEEVYVTELLKIYSEAELSTVGLATVESSKYADHFSACRSEFYCAEGLKRFSRDLFAEDEFAELLKMVYTGVRSAVADPRHAGGFDRLSAAQIRASSLVITDSKLSNRIRGGDMSGTCHHLANERKLKWVR